MATEKRLIDANALQRLLLPIATGLEKEYGSLGGAVSGVMMHIDNAPTVDAVEVVRCKDCFANGCCSVQIDLDMGDEGYCPKGRKESR